MKNIFYILGLTGMLFLSAGTVYAQDNNALDIDLDYVLFTDNTVQTYQQYMRTDNVLRVKYYEDPVSGKNYLVFNDLKAALQKLIPLVTGQAVSATEYDLEKVYITTDKAKNDRILTINKTTGSYIIK